MSVAIRQSGGASIVTIPKAITRSLGLDIGSELEITIDQDRIVLTPSKPQLTLEQLLRTSPKSCFVMSEEDRQWEGTKSLGEEY